MFDLLRYTFLSLVDVNKEPADCNISLFNLYFMREEKT